MSIQVRRIENDRLNDFLRVPFAVYRDDPNWAAPIRSAVKRTLDVRRNPFFSRASLDLFVCDKDGDPAGRVAVIVDPEQEKISGRKIAFFGFFECLNDREAAKALFGEAERCARSRKAEVLEGPFNPNHYSEVGIQIDRFAAAPAFFEPHHPPYYSVLLSKSGFRVSAVLQTMKNDDIRGYLTDRYSALPGPGDGCGYTVRSFSPAARRRDLELIREVNNDAFSGNWRFRPLSADEYLFEAKYLSLVTRPDLIKIVEHRGRAVAVLHCVLDIHPLLAAMKGRSGPLSYLRFRRGRAGLRRLIVYSVGIKKAYQHSRVYALLLREFRAMAGFFDTASTTWVLPENVASLRAAESLGMVPDKRFAVYEKGLG